MIGVSTYVMMLQLVIDGGAVVVVAVGVMPEAGNEEGP